MNAVVHEANLPEPVARRGIMEAQWRTLMNNLYPGAAPDSVLMVWDYCKARKLDPLKKPCHIVPMRVKDARTGDYSWRDVVMPGIYEYRTTATRTGQYMGHSAPVYGPEIEFKGLKVPESCAMTIYRWNEASGQRVEFPVFVRFVEVVALTKEGKPNDRWTKAGVQMLTKCTEAAGLREAFPDELGGETTAEEMEGQLTIEAHVHNPRDGIEPASPDTIDKLVGEVTDILAQDSGDTQEAQEAIQAEQIFAVHQRICSDESVYTALQDALKARGIIKPAGWKTLVAIGSKAFQERAVIR